MPVMTNVVAKVTQQQSQGTWDGGAVEASCGLVIMGLRSAGANTPLTVSQQPDSSGTGGHLRPKLFSMQHLLTRARLKVIYIRCSAAALNEQELLNRSQIKSIAL